MSVDESERLRRLIVGMRATYAAGGNAMQYARTEFGSLPNDPIATLIAYDLQAGSYVANAQERPEVREKWCAQVVELLRPLVDGHTTMLEVGCGEATTLAGVLDKLPQHPRRVLGFDISWSRCHIGRQWLATNRARADLFVADLFTIPLATSSVDIVYTSHSLEPNGGREVEAIKELLRVARRVVVLIEPLYEFASPEARERMKAHGYVRGLQAAAESLGAKVVVSRLLDYSVNPQNPSGVMILEKSDTRADGSAVEYICPLTGAPMNQGETAFTAPEVGIVYPILDGIPLLRPAHAVVASAFQPAAAG